MNEGRVFFEVPADWDDLSRDEQEEFVRAALRRMRGCVGRQGRGVASDTTPHGPTDDTDLVADS